MLAKRDGIFDLFAENIKAATFLTNLLRSNVGNEKTRKLLAKISEALFGKNDEEKLIELLTDRITFFARVFASFAVNKKTCSITKQVSIV